MSKDEAMDFDELVEAGKIQTYDWKSRTIAAEVAAKRVSSREDRIRLADAVIERAATTAGYFLHPRKA